MRFRSKKMLRSVVIQLSFPFPGCIYLWAGGEHLTIDEAERVVAALRAAIRKLRAKRATKEER